MQKNLHNSKKSSTFAPAFEKCQMADTQSALLNGVMVALQILVLSVWVRVLVEQQKMTSLVEVIFCCLNLWTRTQVVVLHRLIEEGNRDAE